MPEQSDKITEVIEPIREVIYDIRDRLIRVEERQTRTEAIEAKADDANEIAREAKRIAQDNAKDIDGMKNTAKWAVGLFATAIITMSAAIIGLFAVFLN